MDAQVRQHFRLAFGGGGAVASHGWEDERGASARFPVIHHGAHDRRDVVDATAAYSDCNSRAGLEVGAEARGRQLFVDLAGNVFDAPVREILADEE